MKKPLLLFFVIALGCAAKQQTASTVPGPTNAAVAKPAVLPPPYVEINAFVLARCQYGAEAMRALLGLSERLGGAVALRVGFIGALDEQGVIGAETSDVEVQTASIHACVEQSADEQAYLVFARCAYAGETWRSLNVEWERCAKKAGLDKGTIAACLSSGKGRAAVAESYGFALENGIDRSPTVIVGDRLYLGGFNADELASYVCFAATSDVEKPAACDSVAAPPQIAATLLQDSRCKDPESCDVAYEVTFLRELLPGLRLANLDFATPEGRHMFELIQKANAKIDELPLLVLDNGVDRAETAKQRLSDLMVAFGDGYLLPLGRGWKPLAEICDNSVDDTADGKTDCADASCALTLACRPEKKGRLELFIMSQCPFGVRMLEPLDRALSHLGRRRKNVDLSLRFIGSKEKETLVSMHGPMEVAEDLRMICAEELYGKDYQFMDYVTCRAKDYRSENWQACVHKGMNQEKLRKCAEGEQGKKLLAASFDLAATLKIQGSPSWLLNGKHAMQGRTAEGIVKAFCERNDLPACKKPMPAEPKSTEAALPEEAGQCH